MLGAAGSGLAAAGPYREQIGVFAVVVATSAVAVALARGHGHGARVVRSCEVALVSMFGVFAAAGSTALVGPTTVWMCLLVVGTCPMVMTGTSTWLRRLFTRAEPSARPTPASPFLSTDGPLPLMTTAELCTAWRHSSAVLAQLRESGTAHAQLRVVAARQEYLDEFELRHPDGFARWLHRGAEGAEVPSCYLPARRRSQP